MSKPSAVRSPSFRRALIRALSLLVLVPVLPACNYSSNGKMYSVPSSMGMAAFKDDFSGTFPAPNWTTPMIDAGGNGTAAIDAGMGNPAPSLAFSAKARPASVATMTHSAWTALNVTLSVQVDASSTVADTVTVQIFDNSAALVADAVYNASTGALTLNVGATSMGTVATTGAFHTIAFHVDGTYHASWSVDGGAAMAVTSNFFPSGQMVTLGLRSDFSGAAGAIPTFLFDNVEVTNP